MERAMVRHCQDKQSCLGEQTPSSMETPPTHTTHPNETYFGRLMQACIRHTHIGEYYRDFKILEDTLCPCSTELQTQIHILAECLLFDEHRHLLHDEEQNIIPTDLFSTKEGIEHFTEFLTKTNTFTHCNQE
jgi:hypothetical protein